MFKRKTNNPVAATGRFVKMGKNLLSQADKADISCKKGNGM